MTSDKKRLPAGSTIGIIGGGQLGRMLAMAAARLGYKTICLDPSKDAPAFQVCNTAMVAEFNDSQALESLFQQSQTVTYEFENVPVETLEKIQSQTPLRPGLKPLRVSQDRVNEKGFCNGAGIKTAPWRAVQNADELTGLLDQLGGKAVLKTRRLGYDGKGQVRLNQDDSDSMKAAETLAQSTDCILEGFVEFDRELSVIIARDVGGNVRAYEPAENVHKEGILSSTTLPARVSSVMIDEAQRMAAHLAKELDYVGVMGVEFFACGERLLVNEFAPRVHNSGHWTEAACAVSQFEQHIRAITANSLGNPAAHSDCRMENLLGGDIDRIYDLAIQDNVMVHSYGKSEAKPGRKMGHFTRIFPRSKH